MNGRHPAVTCPRDDVVTPSRAESDDGSACTYESETFVRLNPVVLFADIVRKRKAKTFCCKKRNTARCDGAR